MTHTNWVLFRWFCILVIFFGCASYFVHQKEFNFQLAKKSVSPSKSKKRYTFFNKKNSKKKKTNKKPTKKSRKFFT